MEPDTHRQFDGITPKPAPIVQVYHGKVPKPQLKHHKRRWLRYTISSLVIILAVGVSLVGLRSRALSNKVFVGSKASFFQQIIDLIRGTTGQIQLTGETEKQINVLLLGIGGEGHDGPYLTDTMIVAHVDLERHEVSLTSIPRDYLADLPGFGELKINSAFANTFGKTHDYDAAGKAARDAASKLSGYDIPYFAVIDFSGFEKAINEVGGVDVTVDRSFTDYQYPDSGIGYLPPQAFTEGPQHMDGARALIFARSRHAAGPEGSDFARSERQHKILESFKTKVTQLKLVNDAGTINKLLSVFADHFHTNISAAEILHLYTLLSGLDESQIGTASLDPDTGLICPQILPSNGAYVLVPCPGKTDTDIKEFFSHSFTLGKMKTEKSVVWVATEDTSSRVYKKIEGQFQSLGLTVWPIHYPELVPESTVIYQVNDKPATKQYIIDILHARTVTLPPPNIKIDEGRVDLIVILGKNAQDLFPATLPAPSNNTKNVPETVPLTQTTPLSAHPINSTIR